MGKNQHSKDRMFITATEWATLYGGKKAASQSHREFKQLPFDACALTFQSFENPMCTAEGHVFELLNILPYIKKHGVNPATGKPLRAKDLTRLHYHKNADGKYHCPVTFKVFNDSTHIVAVRPSGNVYSKDAVDQFNIKAKHWFDLLTDEPFKRADIIDLQDPNHPEKNNFVAFHHVKNPDDDKAAPSTSELRSSTVSTSSILKELAETEETWKANPLFHSSADAEETQAKQRKPKSKEHAAHFSTGQAAASFTSTHMNVHTQNTASALEDDIVRYGKIKSKGYVTIKTNYGDLNVELHCSLAPQTCDNFIRHCKAGYYNDTSFHRSIKSFMIQGGDPTGTGRGGKSAFGKGEAFKDEFASQLSHKGRGVLSMANSGKNTNKSQFFITYRSCVHLDRKHTVFGQVVGHIETLDEIERVPTGEADKPLQDIRILETIVYKDPYAELELEDERKAAAADAKKKAQELLVEAPRPKAHGTGVGKYVAQLAPKQAESAKRSAASSSASSSAVSSKYKQLAAKRSKSGYGNFSGW